MVQERGLEGSSGSMVITVSENWPQVMLTYTYDVAVLVFFFFSSRRRHTRLQGDWSSDVCSSDLWTYRVVQPDRGAAVRLRCRTRPAAKHWQPGARPRVQRLFRHPGFLTRPGHAGPRKHGLAARQAVGAAVWQIGRASCRERG